MVATYMPNPKEKNSSDGLIPSSWAVFLEQLRRDFPDYRFISGRKFAFRPPRTIVYIASEEYSKLLILHEVGHALSGHRFFGTDVERIKMEVEAWEKAKELAMIYEVDVDDDLIQEELDTYRDWLHKKSRCPECGLTRFQTPDGVYHCPVCS